MLKSALAIAISLSIFAFTAPPASAAPSEKKQVQKKKRKHIRHSATIAPKLKTNYQRVAFGAGAQAAPVYTAGDLAGLNTKRDPLALRSNAALVVDQTDSQILFEKNSGVPLPIASLTKLMTALVVIEAGQDMGEMLEVTADDIDRERNSISRLRVGAQLTRKDMLHIALMSSENRAASALGRNYPGGLPAFAAAMNAKAKATGMADSHFVEPTGLSSHNVSSARDLARLVAAAYRHPAIRDYSTDHKYIVKTGRRPLQYVNSNRLVASSNWQIGLQKTGYIAEAGRCLVMHAKIDGRPVVMVFLDSKGRDSRLGDASRIRNWLHAKKPHGIAPLGPQPVAPQPIAPQQVTFTAAKQS